MKTGIVDCNKANDQVIFNLDLHAAIKSFCIYTCSLIQLYLTMIIDRCNCNLG